ncbi:hypothetical protein FN846DRAFT_469203 [Sphaerosporella brunnea]|uniref:Uncharacterized protein n=1 Tax=Sphaerosporella brunnea TaxID=1250544 RepID=A0A5J5F4J0_9PEZI|nr:hypothetical protein FN846DRAFT_469203 [Sphaerosporella brunnea]
MLHQIVNHLTQATKFQKLAVMVLCYRSPIDDEQAHPSGLDRARTLGQARRHRIDLVKDALGFSAFNDMVVGKSVVMVETLRDLDLAHELQKFSEDYLLETASPRFAIPTVVKGPEPNRTTRNLSPGSKRKLQEETQQAVKAKRTRVSGPSAPQFSMSSGGSSSESASDTRGTKRKMQTGIESRPAIAPKAPARQIPNGAQQQVKPSMAPQKSAPPVRKTSMSIVEASRRDSPLNRYLAKKAEEESLDEARRRVKTKMELQGFKVTVRSTSDTTTPTKSQPSPAQVDTTPLTEGIKRLEEQLKGLNEYIEANQLPESPCT